MPSEWMLTCYLDATAPFPSTVQSVQVQSIQFITLFQIRVVASWEEPAQVNGILVEYSICIGQTVLSDSAECAAPSVMVTVEVCSVLCMPN